jgi:uncharacterized lipoprotein YbaY
VRTVAGEVVFPSNAPTGKAAVVVIEVRDTSVSDARSTVVAEQRVRDADVTPNGRLPFRLEVPAVDPRHSLSMRVHVDFDGDGRVSSGDLLTTSLVAASPTAQVTGLVVPVTSV